MIYVLSALALSNVVLIITVFYIRRRQIATIERLDPVFKTIRENRKSLMLLEKLFCRKRGVQWDDVYTFEFPEFPIFKPIDHWGKKSDMQYTELLEKILIFEKKFMFGEADTITISVTKKENGENDKILQNGGER